MDRASGSSAYELALSSLEDLDREGFLSDFTIDLDDDAIRFDLRTVGGDVDASRGRRYAHVRPELRAAWCEYLRRHYERRCEQIEMVHQEVERRAAWIDDRLAWIASVRERAAA